MKKQQTPSMYDLYKVTIVTYIPFLIFAGGACALFCGGIYDFLVRGFSWNTIFFVIASGIIALLSVVFFYATKVNHYEYTDHLRVTDPERLKEMEEDYAISRELCYRIRQGQKYYFFRGTNFFVIPIGGILDMKIKKDYNKNIGKHYDITFTSAEGSVEVTIIQMIMSYEDMKKMLQNMR